MYVTQDIAEQRRQMLAELRLEALRVLDVGSGPGLLAAEMTAAGATVTGIDPSRPMLELAARLHPGLDFREGDAGALGFAAGEFDLVCSTQVLEYVSDVPAALAEFKRVLRPGGVAAILDTDWDSIVWSVDDRPRLRAILDAWEQHVTDPHLPVRLAAELREAGFQNIACRVIPIVNLEYNPERFGHSCSNAIAAYVTARNLVGPEQVDSWLAELAAKDAAGRYFFSLNRYLFTAQSPG